MIVTGNKIEAIYIDDIKKIDLNAVEDCIDYEKIIPKDEEITFTATISKKSHYHLMRLMCGKKPLKPGNNRWRNIRKAENKWR